MSLDIINETAGKLLQNAPNLSDEEKSFVIEFAFKTNDKELTNKLIDELIQKDSDFQSIKEKFQIMYDVKPKWMCQIENLLVALEMYRIEEEKAINRLSDILSAYGITLAEDEIRQMDTQVLMERVQKEAII